MCFALVLNILCTLDSTTVIQRIYIERKKKPFDKNVMNFAQNRKKNLGFSSDNVTLSCVRKYCWMFFFSTFLLANNVKQKHETHWTINESLAICHQRNSLLAQSTHNHRRRFVILINISCWISAFRRSESLKCVYKWFEEMSNIINLCSWTFSY